MLLELKIDFEVIDTAPPAAFYRILLSEVTPSDWLTEGGGGITIPWERGSLGGLDSYESFSSVIFMSLMKRS